MTRPIRFLLNGRGVTLNTDDDCTLLWVLRTEGLYMANNGYDLRLALEARQHLLADLISFGRLYIANPDLVERFHTGAPLNAPDRATFFFRRRGARLHRLSLSVAGAGDALPRWYAAAGQDYGHAAQGLRRLIASAIQRGSRRLIDARAPLSPPASANSSVTGGHESPRRPSRTRKTVSYRHLWCAVARQGSASPGFAIAG
jgi:hypothetical protein